MSDKPCTDAKDTDLSSVASACSNFVWDGDLDDDCSLRVGDWTAHVEMMGDFKAQLDGKGSRYTMVEYWYCAVYFKREQFYHSGDAGGFICSGAQCRAICESIIRGR